MSEDPITRAAAAIAEANPEILHVMATDELRQHVEQFVAALENIAIQRKAEIV